jgi:hypothetical protein
VASYTLSRELEQQTRWLQCKSRNECLKSFSRSRVYLFISSLHGGIVMEELELNSFFFPPLFVERGRERESSHSILCRSLNLTCAQVRFHLHLSDQSNQLFHRLYKISDITFVFFHPSFRGPFPLWASIVQQSMKG